MNPKWYESKQQKGTTRLELLGAPSPSPDLMLWSQMVEYRRNRRHLLPVNKTLPHCTQVDLKNLLSQLRSVPDNSNMSKDALHAEENIQAEPTAQKLPYRTRYGQISKCNPKYTD